MSNAIKWYKIGECPHCGAPVVTNKKEWTPEDGVTHTCDCRWYHGAPVSIPSVWEPVKYPPQSPYDGPVWVVSPTVTSGSIEV